MCLDLNVAFQTSMRDNKKWH